PLLDLVAEGVEVPLVLPTETVHLLLELVPDVVRRLPRLPVAFVACHPWITACLRPRAGQGGTASALSTQVCGTRCRLVPSLVRKWHPELKLLLSVLCVGQPEYSTGSEGVPNEARTIGPRERDRKSTRLNSSHEWMSYAVFSLKKQTWITR